MDQISDSVQWTYVLFGLAGDLTAAVLAGSIGLWALLLALKVRPLPGSCLLTRDKCNMEDNEPLLTHSAVGR